MPLTFSNRSEAFSAMLAQQLDKGVDPLVAAKNANEFADIFAKNMGLPDKQEPELKGADKYIYNIDKVVNYVETHPKFVEILVGLATFGVGVFTGKKIDQNNNQSMAEETPREPINFDEIPD